MKLNTTKLIVLLAALVAIYFGVDYFGGKKKSTSLRSELVNVDTEAVSKLEIATSNSKISVQKTDGKWEVTLENGEVFPADENSVQQSLKALNGIKPSRMATRKKEKWAEYQVDSAGTNVAVSIDNQVVTEIVLGKFGVSGQRSYHTFVRMAEDNEVYVAENFMSFSVPAESSAYRLKNVTSLKKDSIISAQFTYPSDTSFLLEKVGDSWMANSLPTDSTKVAQFLNGLSSVTSRKFSEKKPQNSPVYSVSYSTQDGGTTTVNGYIDEAGLIFNSNQNATSYFADSLILEKVFIGFSELQ
ncbi:MAG: DUF4340 domain-containing protein [Reichenbachiella sp.]